MQQIPQRKQTDCAIACFAMLMNISYRRAMKLLYPWKRFDIRAKTDFSTNGTKLIDAAKDKLNERLVWGIIGSAFPLELLNDDAILILHNKDTNRWHAMMWDYELQNTYDPHIRDPLTYYEVKQFLACVILKYRI